MGFGYDDVAIVGDFHGLVLDAKGADEFHAADFKPDEIIGVVNDAHLVGLGVTHADGGVVILKHEDSSEIFLAAVSFGIAAPLGFAFFEKRSQTFFEIRSATDAGVFQNGAFEIGVDGARGRSSEQALGASEAAGAGFDQHGGQFLGAIHQAIGFDNFIDQAELLGFRGGDHAASEQQIAGALVADLADEKNRDDGW